MKITIFFYSLYVMFIVFVARSINLWAVRFDGIEVFNPLYFGLTIIAIFLFITPSLFKKQLGKYEGTEYDHSKYKVSSAIKLAYVLLLLGTISTVYGLAGGPML